MDEADNHSPVVDDVEDELEEVIEDDIDTNARFLAKERTRIELAKLHILQDVVVFLQAPPVCN